MNNIKETVNNLIDKYETNCPFKIAKQRNIIIIYNQLKDYFGYFNTYKRCKFIHINNQLDETLQRFVCAHELGHAILHPRTNTPFLKKNTLFSTEKIELEANTFAAELLIPDVFFTDFDNSIITAQQAASIYGVPEHVVKFKKMLVG